MTCFDPVCVESVNVILSAGRDGEARGDHQCYDDVFTQRGPPTVPLSHP